MWDNLKNDGCQMCDRPHPILIIIIKIDRFRL